MMKVTLIFTILCSLFNIIWSENDRMKESSCILDPDSRTDWSEEPPIMTHMNGDLVLPEGSANDRSFEIVYNQVVILGCPGSYFTEFSVDDGPLYARCQGGDKFLVWETEEGDGWVEYGLGAMECNSQPDDTTSVVDTCGPKDVGTKIQIEFDVTPDLTTEAVTITVCHDLHGSRTLWSRHTIWDEISAYYSGNNRPSFSPDDYFDYDVNHFYKTATQKETIADLVGSQALADEYIQGQMFFSRGHLAPNADFIFHSWMDSTFHFINVAPQWQCFNGINWAQFEASCRDLAIERGLDLIVYTGTHGVTQLKDVNGQLVDIYLYNGDKLPVPRFFWKILYDQWTLKGVALVGVNNPHLDSIPDDYVVCPPLSQHVLLPSDNQDIYKGYMYACRIEDLASAFPEVPDLPPMDLLE